MVKQRKKVRLYVVIPVGVIVFLILADFVSPLFYNNKLQSTLILQKCLNAEIFNFEKEVGRLPVSLDEIRARSDGKSGKQKEYLSNSDGCNEEHKVVNGKGGWHYNNITGEVKVNLLKPVKKYIWYWGARRNEIPFEWTGRFEWQQKEKDARIFLCHLIDSINSGTGLWRNSVNAEIAKQITKYIHKYSNNYEIKILKFDGIYEYALEFDGNKKYYFKVVFTMDHKISLTSFQMINREVNLK